MNVLAEWLCDVERDLVSAYGYVIRLAAARELGALPIQRLRQLEEAHRNQAAALLPTDLLALRRPKATASVVVARFAR